MGTKQFFISVINCHTNDFLYIHTDMTDSYTSKKLSPGPWDESRLPVVVVVTILLTLKSLMDSFVRLTT